MSCLLYTSIAEDLLGRGKHIDLLMNNAGTMSSGGLITTEDLPPNRIGVTANCTPRIILSTVVKAPPMKLSLIQI